MALLFILAGGLAGGSNVRLTDSYGEQGTATLLVAPPATTTMDPSSAAAIIERLIDAGYDRPDMKRASVRKFKSDVNAAFQCLRDLSKPAKHGIVLSVSPMDLERACKKRGVSADAVAFVSVWISYRYSGVIPAKRDMVLKGVDGRTVTGYQDKVYTSTLRHMAVSYIDQKNLDQYLQDVY